MNQIVAAQFIVPDIKRFMIAAPRIAEKRNLIFEFLLLPLSFEEFKSGGLTAD